ncbi:NADH dehydrogenase [ubiquinone] 1 beta subcomplex subunit 8, mitochondrial isoform X2 [Dermacentor andersoni]|uniref:NADH dehydrogenase [ubiquinone] 1 beta subcomplex subunit 8, mitochondrial isoform X2 n=1 Tax=Dermacentor andersoni TaxID=34620 RepID=UPI00241795DC|nr:NADH dehydrogenase [ubiquinone] 1 beta subcomplex subunit 8, mitochondrial-like isoform X2 [Dermacentor andersoni]
MAALVGRSGRFGQIVRYQLKAPLITSCRSAHWNKDWCPKPAPQTEEEIRAAAKKYRMLPEDYKVRDKSEGLTWGDYPKIPTVPAGSRDPEEDYDFPYLRRNYGEPINIYMDAYTLERLDLPRQRTPMVHHNCQTMESSTIPLIQWSRVVDVQVRCSSNIKDRLSIVLGICLIYAQL